jgi:hypothetical protein
VSCTFYYNTGIETPGCPPSHTFILPSALDYYVYFFPVFFGLLLLMAMLIRYQQIKNEYIRRLIVEQPT